MWEPLPVSVYFIVPVVAVTVRLLALAAVNKAVEDVLFNVIVALPRVRVRVFELLVLNIVKVELKLLKSHVPFNRLPILELKNASCNVSVPPTIATLS